MFSVQSIRLPNIFLISTLLTLIYVTMAQQNNLEQKSQQYQTPTTSSSSIDYIDVPVRSGYRIISNDDEGFLEDGIIVKTKGTGLIDPRYRNRRSRYDDRSSSSSSLSSSQVIGGARRQHNFTPSSPSPSPMMTMMMMMPSESNYYPSYYYPKKRSLRSEIIYGRRNW
ncbi:hypothetical protein NH340_JMT08733 [Sarcoptes scabiei]|nr:hypothetical protein NH340_JMT08733 [Sarcoptes scabiei]